MRKVEKKEGITRRQEKEHDQTIQFQIKIMM